MSDYTEYLAKQQRAKDIECARVRGWGYFLGAYLTGPIWPGLVASRTGAWAPFWGGLALGVCSLPRCPATWVLSPASLLPVWEPT